MMIHKLETEFGYLFDQLEALIEVERPTQDDLNKLAGIIYQEPKVRSAFESIESLEKATKTDGILPDAFTVWLAFKRRCIETLLVIGKRLAVDASEIATQYEAEWLLAPGASMPVEIVAKSATAWHKLWLAAENAQNGRTQTDTDADTGRKTTKKNRINPASVKAGREYRRRLKTEPNLKINKFVREYLEENEGSFSSLTKALHQHHELWNADKTRTPDKT